MERFLVGIFLSLVALTGLSQQSYTALELLLAKPDDTLKVSQLNNYSTSIREGNYNEALKVAEAAKALAEKLKFRKGLAPILENIGWIVYRKGNFAKALIYANESMEIYKEFNDKRGVANCINNLSGILTEQRRYEESIKILRNALALAKEIGDWSVMSRCATNMALGFLPINQLDSAQYFTMLAIDYGIKANDPYRVAFGKRTLGDIFLEKSDYKNAQKNFFEALLPAEMNGSVFLEASTLYRIAKTYFATKNYDKALFYLERNKILVEKFEFKTERERTYALMADIYRDKRDYPKIVYYQDLYLTVHDSLLTQRSNEQMTLQLARYESEIQQAQIDLLKKDAVIQGEEISIHRLWNSIFITGLIVLACLGAIMYFGYQRVKKINTDLQDRNQKINEQAQKLRELNATKDKIFSIIGHDLRGPLASLRGLMGLLAGANLSHEEFISLSKKLKNNLDFVSDDLDNLLSWARSQAGGIQPRAEWFNAHTMVHELNQLYAETARAKSVALENAIPQVIEIKADCNHVKLILRNLIGNAIKFSSPGNCITAHGHAHDGKVHLSIVDEGKGMSDHELENLFFIGTHFTKLGTNNEKGLGIGLLLVKEFVEKNNGTISVTSQLGKGSTFTVSLQGQNGES
ncbi:MAG TPA: tetratricopeptide repeat-containing sensor histidine kinase [Cyclobacteriaceae bacterium]|nr:tetratricopeptide repeat-containing sensor histidine kinase [Cyclobacteriaceae bacterium]